LELLDITPDFAKRFLNEGFSGGEKKRNEILQMGMLKPEMAVMDETDSGLDIDALKIVSRGVNAMRGPNFGALVITHYQRLLNYIVPDYVHILVDGRIVKTGDKSLALQMEEQGYEWVKDEVAA
jgi:Fe-S cluster assembly ATP-binding protein